MKKIIVPFLASFLLGAGCSSSPVWPGSGVAQGTVKGSVGDVNQRAQNVLKEMKIELVGTSVQNSGNEIQLVGKMEDVDVAITIDNASHSTSNVQVKASKNIMTGEKELAQDILSRIVSQG